MFGLDFGIDRKKYLITFKLLLNINNISKQDLTLHEGLFFKTLSQCFNGLEKFEFINIINDDNCMMIWKCDNDDYKHNIKQLDVLKQANIIQDYNTTKLMKFKP